MPDRPSDDKAAFPIWENPPQTHEEVISLLKGSPELYTEFLNIRYPQWRGRFLDFCSGKKSLPLTYDPFFKFVFNPVTHADRLEAFISAALGMKVTIHGVLNPEDGLMDGQTYLIMDLVVELEDGSIVDVEIQKEGYLFPEARVSCYSSDLLLRQYTRVKSSSFGRFSYKDIHKVYVIVIFEESPSSLKKDCKNPYHYGRTVFDTGIELGLLQEYCFICLDVFIENNYSMDVHRDLEPWLCLLSTNNLSEADAHIARYPWLEEIYIEIAMLRHKPGEVIGMWSEAIRMLDKNTMQLYVDELKKEAERLEERNERLSDDNEKLSDDNAKLFIVNEKLSSDNQKLTDDNQKLTDDNQKLTDDNQKLTDDNQKLIDDNEKLADDKAKLMKELLEREQALNEQAAAIRTLQVRLEKIEKQFN